MNKINRNLTLLLAGRVVSDIGSSINMMILPLYIIDIGGSASLVGLLSFTYLMPILLVYPFSGVLGDRLNRKWIMVATDLISAVAVFVLAAASAMDRMSLVLLLAMEVVVGMMYGFFDPATKGMIPKLVDKEDLPKTNSKVATQRILAGLVSPVLAVTLYSAFGISVLFLLNALSFLVSGTSEFFIGYEGNSKSGSISFKVVVEDMKEGAAFIRDTLIIRQLSLYFLLIYMFIHPIFGVVLPLFFRTRLAYSDSRYGYLQMILLAGALFGSVLVGYLAGRRDLKKLVVQGVYALVLTMFGFGALTYPVFTGYLGNDTSAYLALLAGMLFLLYTSVMFINIPVQTLIQKVTPEDHMSRVFSIMGVICKGGMPLGALVYGVTLEVIEIQHGMTGAAVFVAAISIVFVSLFKKH